MIRAMEILQSRDKGRRSGLFADRFQLHLIAELDRIPAVGAERARAVAEPKIEQVKRKVGLIVP